MGAFDFLFKKPKAMKQVNGYFGMLDGYTPIFSTYDGGVYEMELTRACIHTFANHCSKLLPTVTGADAYGVQALLDGKPNPFMTSAQFVYKVATIYDAKNTCFIVPLLDKFDRLIGYYPVNPQQTEVVDVSGEPWLRFTLVFHIIDDEIATSGEYCTSSALGEIADYAVASGVEIRTVADAVAHRY